MQLPLRWGLLAAIFIGLWCRHPALAQETGGKPSEPAAATSAASKTDAATIYVPYQELEAAFERGETQVLVPYQEYRALLASREALLARARSVPAFLSAANYQVRVADGIARISATLEARVTQAGARLPVKFGTAAIGDSRLPESVQLQGAGAGEFIFHFSESGAQTLRLELSVPVTETAAGKTVVWDCPAVPVNSLEFSLDEKNQTLDVEPRLISAAPSTDSGNAGGRVSGVFGPASQVRLSWQSKAEAAPTEKRLVGVDIGLMVTVTENFVHADATLNCDVLRGELKQFRFVIPAKVRLVNLVSQEKLQDWKTETAGERQVVTVTPLVPQKKRLQLKLDLETPLEQGELRIAGKAGAGIGLAIEPLDVIRATGQVGLRASSGLMLHLTPQQGVIRIPQAESTLNATRAEDSLFRFYAADYLLELTSRRIQPRVAVTHLTRLVFQSSSLQGTDDFQFLVERAGLFELRFRVPAGVSIDQVTGSAVSGHRVEEGVLIVPLKEQTQGKLDVRVLSHQKWDGQPGQSLLLPILEPVDVERESGTVQVFALESLEVQSDGEAATTALPAGVEAGRTLGNAVLNAAWTYQQRPVEIRIKVQPKPSRLSAQVATALQVQQDLAQVDARLDYFVEFAPIDTFRFDVPEAVSSRVQVTAVTDTGAGIAIREASAGKPADGRVVWTVVTQQPLKGHQIFRVQFSLPMETGSAAGSAAHFQFEPPRPLGHVDAQGADVLPLTQRTGEISLTGNRTLAVTAVPRGALEAMDVRELKTLPADATLAYRYSRDEATQPVGLTVTAARLEIQPVVRTVVPRGLVEISCGEDAQATFRCRYQVQTAERQRLLVALPALLEVLEVKLNETDIALEKADVKLPAELRQHAPYWINISRASDSNETVLLTFQFLWKVEPPLSQSRFGSGNLGLPLPVIDADGNGAVQELNLVLYVPQRFALVGNAGPFQVRHAPRCGMCRKTPHVSPPQVAELQSWIQQGISSGAAPTDIPTEGRLAYAYLALGQVSEVEVRWWNRFAMTALFSLAVALAGLILLSTSWENKLGAVLTILFAAALFGLYDPTLVRQSFQAAAPGILFTLGLWLLHALWRLRSNGRARSSRPVESRDVPASPAPVSEQTLETNSENAPPAEDSPDQHHG